MSAYACACVVSSCADNHHQVHGVEVRDTAINLFVLRMPVLLTSPPGPAPGLAGPISDRVVKPVSVQVYMRVRVFVRMRLCV